MRRVFSAPNHVDLCITTRCNMRCKHCFAKSGNNLQEETSFDRLKLLIDRLAEAKVFTVILTGGEPLIREDFFEIVSYIKRHPMRIGLNTNATLVTEEGSERIADAGFRCRISVSLDGSGRESYERLRGPGTFEPAIKGLENLLKFNKNVRPFCTVTKYNFRELEDIIKLARSLRAPCVEFNCLMEGDRATCYRDLALDGDDEIKALERISELKEDYGNYIKGSFVREAKTAKRFRTMSDDELLRLSPRSLQNCNAGFSMACVRADGRVTPCYAIPDYAVGDLSEASLKDIWRYSPALGEFRRMHDVSLGDIEPCKACIYKGVCNAGCRAAAFYASGKTRLDTYDPGSCYRFLRNTHATDHT